MITALSQLHHSIHQIGHIRTRRSTRQKLKVLFQNGSIVLLLSVGQLDLDNSLLLRGEILLDVLLESPKHHRFENSLEFSHLSVGLEIAELLHELGARVELLRLEEVEERE